MVGFPRLFKQFIARSLLREKTRSVIAALGVALGVAVMVAVQLANHSVTQSFRAAVDAVGGSATLRIVPTAGQLDETTVADLMWLEEYGNVAPVLENYAMVDVPPARSSADRAAATDQLDRGELLYVMGVDVLRDLPLRKYQLLQLDRQPRDATARQLLRLIVDEDAVVLTEQFARRTGYRVGDTIRLAFGSRQRDLVVRGLLLDEGPARTLHGNFALMDIAAAQAASDRFGSIDFLDLKLKEGLDLDQARKEIRSRLPAGLTAEEPREKAGRTETMIAAFQFNLTALSSVAMLVGLFLIYNTVSVSVAARQNEIGVLRAVGATRSVVVLLFLGEALLLGCVGVAAGLPLGQWLSRFAVSATAQTVETFYIAEVAESTAASATLSPVRLALIGSLALVLTLLAAALPASAAAAVHPVNVLRGSGNEGGPARRGMLFAWAAIVLAICGYALTRLDPVEGQPVFGFLAELLFMFSAAFMTPLLLALICRIIRSLPAWCLPWRMQWKLAAANLQAAIPQTSISVAALSMSLGMMIAIGVMVGSFRQTVVYWLDSILTADVMVKPIMNNSALSTGTIDQATVAALRRDPDVVATCWYSSAPLPYGDEEIRLDTTELQPFLQYGKILFKSPEQPQEAIIAALTEQREFVLVSESFSLRYNKQPGDLVQLETPTGQRRVPIMAVYYDYASNQGTLLLDFATYRRYFGSELPARAPMGVSMYLRSGADPEQTRQRMAREFGNGRSLYFVTNDRIRSEAMRVFESTFAITYALQTIAIVIAGAGVIATLLRLIYERQREIGLLSLVGATERQIQRMIVMEATLIGGVSQLLGMAVGLVLALVLIYVINVQSFGWTLQFHLPIAFLVQSSIAIVIASAAFGLYPGRRAAGMDALQAVREL